MCYLTICFNPMGRDHRKLHESLGKTVSAELERRFASHPNVAQQGKRAEILSPVPGNVGIHQRWLNDIFVVALAKKSTWNFNFYTCFRAYPRDSQWGA